MGGCRETEGSMTPRPIPATREAGARGLAGRDGCPQGQKSLYLPWPAEATRSSRSMAVAFSRVSLSRCLPYSFTHCCSVSRGLCPCVAAS